jgi:hypothetical protein
MFVARVGRHTEVSLRQRARRVGHIDRSWDIANAAQVPENARLFARESLETREKQHKLWET